MEENLIRGKYQSTEETRLRTRRYSKLEMPSFDSPERFSISLCPSERNRNGSVLILYYTYLIINCCYFILKCLLYLFVSNQLKKTTEELNEALSAKEEIAQRCHELDMQVSICAVYHLFEVHHCKTKCAVYYHVVQFGYNTPLIKETKMENRFLIKDGRLIKHISFLFFLQPHQICNN